MFDWFQRQSQMYMPHSHCLMENQTLMDQLIWNDVFTIFQYIVIALCCSLVGRWDTRRKHWYWMMQSTALVFIFCSINYAMNVVVIFYPYYELQIIFKYLGNIFFLKAIYHLAMVQRTELIALISAIKRTLESIKND